MADRRRRFRELSAYLDSFPRQRGAYITVVDDDEKWVFRVQEIKDLLLSHTFEIPALRKELDKAHGEIEVLQEQIEGLCSREDGGVGLARVYHRLLAQIEKLPSDTPVKIKAKDYSFHWDVMAKDIKNLLMAFLFVVPSLRNERNSALEKVETLQEQIASEIAYPENGMAILKRALHYLQKHAGLYYSSGADEVVAELRQLIAEARSKQVEGETLSFEIPKWEYMTMYLSSQCRPHDDKLNKLGDDDWELVAVADSVAYFKRAK